MADTHRTKADLLQELESIKGLLLEDEDIPILQELLPGQEHQEEPFEHREKPSVYQQAAFADQQPPPENRDALSTFKKQGHEIETARANSTALSSVLPGQHSLFDEHSDRITSPADLSPATPTRTTIKAAGENPFLPQHIRARLHGNNPPPLFDEQAYKSPLSPPPKSAGAPYPGLGAQGQGKTRLQLVNEVLGQLQPLIERELRQRLFALSVDDLERLLNEEDDS